MEAVILRERRGTLDPQGTQVVHVWGTQRFWNLPPFLVGDAPSLEERMLALEASMDRVVAVLERAISVELPRLSEVFTGLTEKLSNVQTVEVRDIPREQAKQEILEYIETSGRGSYSDIVNALKLDLRLVVGLCEELTKEGRIEEI